jgi:hypothetical protein
MSWNITAKAAPADLKILVAPNRDMPEGLKAVVYDFCDHMPRRDVIVSLETYGENKADAVSVGRFDLRAT